MIDDYTYQLSIKFGATDDRGNPQDMVNVRAKTAEEFRQNVRALNGMAHDLYLAPETVRAGGLGDKPAPAPVDTPGDPWAPPVSQQVQRPVQPQPAPEPVRPSSPQCAHGPMTHRTGNKNGKGWAGWFCSGPQGQPRCEPKWEDS